MQQYSDVVQDRNGNVISSATILVQDFPSLANSTIYNSSGVAMSNPTITNTDGEYTFYANPGIYSITVSKANIVTESKTVTLGAASLDFLQSGTGAVSRSVQSKLQDVVHIKDFTGADPTGVADSTAALVAAMTSLGTKGGTVLITGGRWLLNSANINVPACVTIRGDFSDWNGGQNINNGVGLDYRLSVTSVLILNPTFTINLSASSGLANLQIVVKGLAFGVNNFVSPPGVMFTGTAISVTPSAVNYTTDGYGVYVGYVQILGFAQAFSSNFTSRCFIERVSLDCNSGISIQNSGDTTRVNDVHIWPYITNAAGVTALQNHRTGSAFNFQNLNDIGLFSNLFVYDHQTGFQVVNGISVASFTNCDADGTNQTGSIGWTIGVQDQCSFVNCSSYNQLIGFSVNDTGNKPLHFTNCRYINSGATGTGWNIAQGTVSIVGGSTEGCAIGISVANSANCIVGLARVNFYSATTNHINAGAAASVLGMETCYYASNQFTGGNNLPVISALSAGALSVPVNGDVFEVSASSASGNIFNFNGVTGALRPGRLITLIFTAGTPPSVVNAAYNAGTGQIHCSGGANFVPTQGGSFSCRYDTSLGTWIEIGRSA